jgi:hypothetical protein
MAVIRSSKPVSPLAKFTATIKSGDKAKRNPAEALVAMIDNYTASGLFDKYITEHAADVVRYLKPETKRPGRWRASAAGKCLQEQAFRVVDREKPGRFVSGPATTARRVETYRALDRGTMGHVIWHLTFDALDDLGQVDTLFAEDLRYYEEGKLSGTVDRVIEFAFDGEIIRAVIDFKTMKSTYFDPLLEPADDHEMQQMAYALFKYDATWWMMLYECKNTHKLKVYARRYDELKIDKVRSNLRKLNNWVDLVVAGAINDQLPRLPLITDWCRYCEWNKPCKVLNPDRDS